MLDNRHRIIAYAAGKMRRFRIRSVVGDRVHVEMTPYEPSKGRIIFRERTPGQCPGPRRRGFRRYRDAIGAVDGQRTKKIEPRSAQAEGGEA